jgi:phosphoglycerate dehydrogenase-like enzyme
MNIFMIAEAASHAEKLRIGLGEGWTIVPLPHEAAYSDAFDDRIAEHDVVVSLRFSRPGKRAPRFGLLHVPGAGVDGIDFECLCQQTTVCNVFEHEIPIAEFVLGQMLEWEIGAAEMRRGFSPEGWSQAYRSRVPHGELYGKTIGIVGFGRIGREIALRARAFGMQVVAVSTRPQREGLADRIVKPEALSSVLGEADYVALACPLNGTTRNMIGAAELTAMKESAVLINVSRAEIVDEAALFSALSGRRIGGAVLDVWYRYPVSADEDVAPSSLPFHTLENALCTPHSSAWTTRLPYRRYQRIADNLERLKRGEALFNVVREGVAARDHQPEGAT